MVRKASMHKFELYIYGFNNQLNSKAEDFVNIVLEGNGKMHSGAVDFCYRVGNVQTVEIEDWCEPDDHPLNRVDTPIDYYRQLFEQKEEVDDKFIKLEEGKCYDVAVFYFPNGNYAVCDIETGWQIPELQGSMRRKAIYEARDKGLIKIVEWKE